MTNSQIELAKEAGCVTLRETGLWYHGYLSGKIDGISSLDVIDDVNEKKRLDALDIEEECRQARIEDEEYYADYSDQEDEKYNKASSNAGELI